MCNCNDLSKYDFKSPAMRAYLGTYGEHFSKELCHDAVSMMRDRNGNPVEMMPKDDVKALLERNGVTMEQSTTLTATRARRSTAGMPTAASRESCLIGKIMSDDRQVD